MANEAYGYHEVGPKPTLHVRCAGSLDLRGDVGTTVRFLSKGGNYSADGGRIETNGDLRVRVPVGATIVLEQVSGDARVKGIQGGVSAEQALAGDAIFSAIDGSLTLHSVLGDFAARNIGGSVTVSNGVSGDAALSHVGAVTIDRVSGDLVVKQTSGSVTIGAVGGDAVVKLSAGALQLGAVSGDCALVNLGGKQTEVNASDDIRIVGPLSVGKHVFNSGSNISLRYPAGSPLALTANAPKIVNRMTFDTVTELGGSLTGSVGSDGPAVTLNAADRITLRSTGEESDGFESFAEVEFDFANLGSRLSEEINIRMADVAERIGPELGDKAERALRRAQAAVDRAISQMERNIAQAERQTQRAAGRAPEPPKPPRPPRPAQPEQGKNTTAEQLKILKLLEDGVITVEDANSLLAALG